MAAITTEPNVTGSGIMFLAVPPWNSVTETTAFSFGSMFQAIIYCRLFTICAPMAIGSIVAFGVLSFLLQVVIFAIYFNLFQ